jgi:hypothetical protein
MGTLRSLSVGQGQDPGAPLVERWRFVLVHLWRGDLPAEIREQVDPPVVGRRVTDEGPEQVEGP